MIFLNLGCGGNRSITEPWRNIDQLYSILPEGSDALANLKKEWNYVDHNILEPFPFETGSVDGILCAHALEHFVLNDSLLVMRNCFKVLKQGGVLRVSVPDPQKFIYLTLAGNKDWGVSDWNDENPHKLSGMSFMENALFFAEHKQMLGFDSLRCLFWLAGFKSCERMEPGQTQLVDLASKDDRVIFSLFVEGVK